uniref:Transporter substrate-binding domain-containing protein n=1 Tax=Candidatus Desulfatibia profunda TaxID=2841695 RepID=A0A8J6NPQ5_9BACT|nr:transporter substrate-binding domain-containing protein [Candidatus Desulfatibia profunda]
MNGKKSVLFSATILVCTAVMLAIISWGSASGADLSEIKKRGVLRHLGVPYANFVTGSGDGLDVELIKRFAEYLGVKYEYVKTDWKDVIGDLAGKKVEPNGSGITILGEVPVKGDLIANGLTIIPWRQKVVDYSTATFPTQIWLVARADSTMKPIKSTGDVEKDVAQVKELLKGHCVLGKAQTCLDPSLYGLKEAGAEVKLFSGTLNELVPAIIKGEAEATISDGPDALITLEKWPGKIKVIGPVSSTQEMGVAFAKTSPELREAFNRFFEKCKADGTYERLVKKYYPAVFMYYPAFF